MAECFDVTMEIMEWSGCVKEEEEEGRGGGGGGRKGKEDNEELHC